MAQEFCEASREIAHAPLDIAFAGAKRLIMKRRSFPTVLFVIAAFAFSSAALADDLKALEGKWKVETMEAGGQQIVPDEPEEMIIRVTGDRYERMTKDGPDGGTIKLDETQNPKTMDVTDTEGLDAGKVLLAIYELADDTLRVCYALNDSPRPTELTTKEGLPWVLITYKREK
jgi:uncharacterized protein (TIGR03067 family)